MDLFYRGAMNPVEHLFNNHVYYDASWCWANDLDDSMFKMSEHMENKVNHYIFFTNEYQD